MIENDIISRSGQIKWKNVNPQKRFEKCKFGRAAPFQLRIGNYYEEFMMRAFVEPTSDAE